jgi:gas vesicle protein
VAESFYEVIMTNQRTDEGAAAAGGFAIGLLWGAAIGAAIALVLAPRPGVETRTQIADSMNRLGRRARDTYDRARSTYDQASGTVTDAATRAADIAEQFVDRAADLTAKMGNRSAGAGPSRVS